MLNLDELELKAKAATQDWEANLCSTFDCDAGRKMWLFQGPLVSSKEQARVDASFANAVSPDVVLKLIRVARAADSGLHGIDWAELDAALEALK